MSRIFISYAREDRAVADRLYRDLEKAGAEPWLDKHDLIAGQGWRGAIKYALRRSSHFICLISQNSARKRGFAQREIREALETLKEIPPDEIYIIPIRLDETETPYEELRELNWVDLFPSYSKGLKQILKALEHSGGIESKINRASGAQERDIERIRAYRQLFDRSAFRLPCVFEYALPEVQKAVEHILAAMSTGKAYSRDNQLLFEVPPRGAFETDAYHVTLDEILVSLNALRRVAGSLMVLLVKASSSSRGKQPPWRTAAIAHSLSLEYFDMTRLLAGLSKSEVPREMILSAKELMDQVDIQRNEILKKLNALLKASRSRALPYITLSSEVELNTMPISELR